MEGADDAHLRFRLAGKTLEALMEVDLKYKLDPRGTSQIGIVHLAALPTPGQAVRRASSSPLSLLLSLFPLFQTLNVSLTNSVYRLTLSCSK